MGTLSVRVGSRFRHRIAAAVSGGVRADGNASPLLDARRDVRTGPRRLTPRAGWLRGSIARVDSCDALVVGGGPAGSTCARALRNAGWDVIVLDRARFPRDKVCAGWVTPGV